MKIALYIEDGLEQIVLTPQSDTERLILSKMTSVERSMQVKKGGFYACHGGWTRQGSDYDSTMIILSPAPKPPAEEMMDQMFGGGQTQESPNAP